MRQQAAAGSRLTHTYLPGAAHMSEQGVHLIPESSPGTWLPRTGYKLSPVPLSAWFRQSMLCRGEQCNYAAHTALLGAACAMTKSSQEGAHTGGCALTQQARRARRAAQGARRYVAAVAGGLSHVVSPSRHAAAGLPACGAAGAAPAVPTVHRLAGTQLPCLCPLLPTRSHHPSPTPLPGVCTAPLLWVPA